MKRRSFLAMAFGCLAGLFGRKKAVQGESQNGSTLPFSAADEPQLVWYPDYTAMDPPRLVREVTGKNVHILVVTAVIRNMHRSGWSIETLCKSRGPHRDRMATLAIRFYRPHWGMRQSPWTHSISAEKSESEGRPQ